MALCNQFIYFFAQVLIHHLLLPVCSQRDDLIISGYLPEYRSYINVNASSMYLTDIILFSLSPETIMGTSDGCCISKDQYDLIREARSYKMEQQNKRLRLYLTIGGAGRSDGFAEVIGGNSEIQETFVNKLIQLCNTEQLDGIDLDNEGIRSMNEWKAYLHFVEYAGAQFRGRNLNLSVVVHPGQFLPPLVCQAVDRVNIMTYDMLSAPGNKPGHHAELSVAKTVIEAFITHGCPSAKLVLGIPAYARNGQNHAFVKTYSEMVDEYGDINLSPVHGYYFDSPTDVKAKVNYAKDMIGGVFFWELGQDKQNAEYEGGILLQAAASASAATADRDEL